MYILNKLSFKRRENSIVETIILPVSHYLHLHGNSSLPRRPVRPTPWLQIFPSLPAVPVGGQHVTVVAVGRFIWWGAAAFAWNQMEGGCTDHRRRRSKGVRGVPAPFGGEPARIQTRLGMTREGVASYSHGAHLHGIGAAQNTQRRGVLGGALLQVWVRCTAVTCHT